MRLKGRDPVKLVEDACRNPAEAMRAHCVPILAGHTPVLSDEVPHSGPGFEAESGVVSPVIDNYAVAPQRAEAIRVEEECRSCQSVWCQPLLHGDLNM